MAVHRSSGVFTCSLVGNPTTGRSTSRRVMWSRNFPDCPQSGHTPTTATGVASSVMVSGPVSAALVMASPISGVRQIVSATRFPLGFTIRAPGGFRGLCRSFHLHARAPICCGDPLNPSFFYLTPLHTLKPVKPLMYENKKCRARGCQLRLPQTRRQ